MIHNHCGRRTRRSRCRRRRRRRRRCAGRAGRGDPTDSKISVTPPASVVRCRDVLVGSGQITTLVAGHYAAFASEQIAKATAELSCTIYAGFCCSVILWATFIAPDTHCAIVVCDKDEAIVPELKRVLP